VCAIQTETINRATAREEVSDQGWEKHQHEVTKDRNPDLVEMHTVVLKVVRCPCKDYFPSEASKTGGWSLVTYQQGTHLLTPHFCLIMQLFNGLQRCQLERFAVVHQHG
jgi:hypothetical protein